MAKAKKDEAAQAEKQAPEGIKVKLLGQFIRDMSFENILAQKGIKTESRPAVSIQVALDARKRDPENHFEVVTKVNIEGKTEKDETLFILELEYAGIFNVENVPEEQLHPILMIECPRLLFPYLHRMVHELSREGGFPPLNLEPIDFVALYRQDMERRAQAAQAEKKDA